MKKFYLIISILSIAITSCSTDGIIETEATQNSIELSNKKPNSLNNNTQIIITDVTRGFYESIEIVGNEVKKTSSGIVPPSSYTLTLSQQNDLNLNFSNLSLQNIKKYNAPSNARFFDGAPFETLEIIHNGITYRSKSYDGGNPPSQIKAFVDFVKNL